MMRAQRGIALIEILVAVAVAMLASLLMFQTMSVGEKSRRAAGSGNDGQRAGSLALDQLSWAVRNAGSGFAQVPGSFNCALQLWRNAGALRVLPRVAALPAPFDAIPLNPLRVAPVSVIDGGAGNPDVLIVMSGSSPSANTAIPRGEPQLAGQFIAVTNTVGLQNNDLVLLTHYRIDALGTSSSDDCFVAQVNALPAQINAASGYIAANPVPVSAGFYSPPPGALPAARYTLSTLGPAPSIVAYGLRRSGGRSDLVSYDLLRDVGPSVVAENVVDFQVLYGVDTSVNAVRSISSDTDFFGDGSVDLWVAPTGDWSSASLTSVGTVGAPAWSGAERQRRVKALRIGLITVDTHTDKDPVPLLDNRLRMFTSADAALVLERTIGSPGYDSRSRYRVLESMVPIRNLTAGLSPLPDDLVY